MDDDKVLAAIAALSEKLDARFEMLEQRLTEQERQSKKAAKASRKAAEVQRQQGADIERLKQIVYLGKQDEKALNIALNKIGGQWDMSLLRDALQDLTLSPVDVNATGYSDDELSVILGDVMLEKQHEESPIDRMTFTFSLEQYADLQQALQIIGAKYKPDQMETFGNTNKTGNRIYMVVKEWVEQKKSKSG